MSVEISIPFQLDKDGKVVTTTNPRQITAQHVKALVSTNPGERVMLSEYGVPLRRYLYEPNNTMLTSELESEVNRAMQAWEPGLTVQSITQIPDEQELGIARLEVKYSMADTVGGPERVNTAIVLIGGKVVEILG